MKLIPAQTVESCATCLYQYWPESADGPQCFHPTLINEHDEGAELAT